MTPLETSCIRTLVELNALLPDGGVKGDKRAKKKIENATSGDLISRHEA
jgi:hypothetical protein